MIVAKELPDRKKLCKLFRYCSKTGSLFWKQSGPGRSMKKPVGSMSNAYPQVRINGELFLLHRVIYEICKGGVTPFNIVDHKDGDTHNNKMSNLRLTDQHTNTKNGKKRKTNKSGVNGVIWNKRNNKWQAFIHINGKQKHLGLFEHKKEAVNARKKAERYNNYSKRHGL